jgi:DNA polymerase-3 subunit delta'
MLSSSTESRLDALAGLESAKRVVRKIASGESSVHAVLLYGAKGSGKTALAEALGEALLCTDPQPDGACGVCRACGAFQRGTSPDWMLIEPQGPSAFIMVPWITRSRNPKPDDPSPTLQEFFRTPPLASRMKVAFLRDAHRMNDRAANALLKTLEEPHPHARLILSTDSVGGVLPTILSRCVALACELPSVDELRDLAPEATVDDLRLAEGAPGRVRTILANPAAYRKISEFGHSLKRRRRAEALKVSEEFRTISEGLQKATDGGARATNAEALDMLAAFLAREPEVPPRWAQHVIEAHRRIVGNGNPGMVLDALFTRMLRRRP